jgi:hypothetical protein
MPFGQKPDATGALIDFDAVYQNLIRPAIEEADLEPLRADEERTGGIIHKAMFERLILCEFAVADLTTANANVFYELGVRHAVRPASTIAIFAANTRLPPFDVNYLRSLPYHLESGVPIRIEETRVQLQSSLRAARQRSADSPIYQLVEGFPDIQRLKTDVFRDRITFAAETKTRLERARVAGVDALQEVETQLGALQDQEAGILVDLFLSYRDVKAWGKMIELVGKMPPPLAQSVLVQEQLALALNRAGDGDAAEKVLKDLLARSGPSSETYGILGRVYKDRWDAAQRGGETMRAAGLLRKAIDAYVSGFEADWRDAYPGINAVTLMEMKDPPDPNQAKLLPVVRYSVERRIATGQPDYWDHATLLELAVLANDPEAATTSLGDALASMRAPWEGETTLRNIRLIGEVRQRRGVAIDWLQEIESELGRAVASR